MLLRWETADDGYVSVVPSPSFKKWLEDNSITDYRIGVEEMKSDIEGVCIDGLQQFIQFSQETDAVLFRLTYDFPAS
jgi:hypothetical protein